MSERKFTKLQGQYLAFIHNYTLMNRIPPAESDMQAFFGVAPPSVHQMVITLEKRSLISRIPGEARTIEVLVPVEEIPTMEAPAQPQNTYVRVSRSQKEAMKRAFWSLVEEKKYDE